jgi:hypothetical protein
MWQTEGVFFSRKVSFSLNTGWLKNCKRRARNEKRTLWEGCSWWKILKYQNLTHSASIKTPSAEYKIDSTGIMLIPVILANAIKWIVTWVAHIAVKDKVFSHVSVLKNCRIFWKFYGPKNFTNIFICKKFVKIRDGFSERYVYNIMRIDRLTDVPSDCKKASQVHNASKIDICWYKNCRNLKQPAQFSRHSD